MKLNLKTVLIGSGLVIVIAVGYGMLQCKRQGAGLASSGQFSPQQYAAFQQMFINNPVGLITCGAGFTYVKIKEILHIGG